MQFIEILGALRRRWLYLVVPLLLSAGLGGFIVQTATPEYEATASVYVSLSAGRTASDMVAASNYAQQQLASFASLATSADVLQPVSDQLGLGITPKALAKRVRAMASSESVILQITASSQSAQQAADIANAVTEQLSTSVEAVSPRLENDKSSVQITTITPATAPSTPTSPNPVKDIGGALVAGLFVGVVAALLRDRLDTRVRGPKDLPAGVHVLGAIPFDRALRRGKTVVLDGAAPARVEAYRRVRANVRYASVDQPARVITVTSAMVGEGKTTATINLAQVFASAGERVLLVDANLRDPQLSKYLGIDDSVGLVDVLVGRVELGDVVRDTADSRLRVLPSGEIPPNPTEMLGSRAMAFLINLLRGHFDVIVIDTPAVVPVVDAAVLAPMTDGVVMVTRWGKTTRQRVEDGVEALRAVDARVLGVAFMGVRSGYREASEMNTRPETPRLGASRRQSGPAASAAAVIAHGRGAGPTAPAVEQSAPVRQSSPPPQSHTWESMGSADRAPAGNGGKSAARDGDGDPRRPISIPPQNPNAAKQRAGESTPPVRVDGSATTRVRYAGDDFDDTARGEPPTP